jgi:hypothetical protein
MLGTHIRIFIVYPVSFFVSVDGLVKSLKMSLAVIPANPGSGSGAGAGIQYFQRLINTLDSGFHRSDDFLGIHQFRVLKKSCDRLCRGPGAGLAPGPWNHLALTTFIFSKG